MFPFPEGEPHVRRPCDKRVAPRADAAGWVRACPSSPSAAPCAAGAVATVALLLRVHGSHVWALRRRRLTMCVDLYRKRIAATVVELARDDPSLVKEVIARLRAAGEIEADDLVYLDRIADRWIAIAEANAQRGASPHPRQSRG
ncbi:conserved hypothetical protein [Verminephrobacter eiseniae EF01-2]|uniref:Uncharacterized protein n=2 Tax=Verminephrobacter eiseniae TaxID=364317 RepID=A1WLL0_VEREI|nr:conserved hypothetical protein [Verminephrobacter eiseniae EF01-2]